MTHLASCPHCGTATLQLFHLERYCPRDCDRPKSAAQAASGTQGACWYSVDLCDGGPTPWASPTLREARLIHKRSWPNERVVMVFPAPQEPSVWRTCSATGARYECCVVCGLPDGFEIVNVEVPPG